MAPPHTVLEPAQAALQLELAAGASGWLLGLRAPAAAGGGAAVAILGAVRAAAGDPASSSSAAADREELEALLPHGLSVVGSFGAAGPPPSAALPLRAELGAEGGRVAYRLPSGAGVSPAVLSAARGGPLPEPLAGEWRLLRCRLALPLAAAAPIDGPALDAAFAAAAATLARPGLAFAAVLPAPAGGGGPRRVLLQGLAPLAEALPPSSAPIECEALERTAPPAGVPPPGAPVLSVTPAPPARRVSATLSLDVLAYVPATASGADAVSAHLAPALRAQLRAARAALAADAPAGALVPAAALHFQPPGWAHALSVVYPCLRADAELSESKLRPRRRRLHALLGLPPDRPALRAAHALDFSLAPGAGAAAGPRRLRDVHAGLPPPAGLGGRTALVEGPYDYYHYLQDGAADAGWGCAYRSLQTLVSWFALNGYTQRPVPGHADIQRLLVGYNDYAPRRARARARVWDC